MEQLETRVEKLEIKVKQLYEIIKTLNNAIDEMKEEDIEFSDPEFIVKNAIREFGR